MMIQVEGKIIGDGNPVYIVAELSGNHGGSFERMITLIHKAKEAGADAVKIQTYKGSTITLDCEKEDFLLPKNSPWASEKNLFSLYEKAHTPWEWHSELFLEAKKIGITIFSSPFDHTAVELLEKLNTPVYKIASPEIFDIPLIKCVAQTKKPVILSTGLANIEDIDLAIETLQKNGCTKYIILKCTTEYPAPLDEVNLLTIPELKKTYNCPVGVSDHTLGLTVPIVSTALGANFIEKHFVDEKENETVDSFFSLDFSEFSQMVSNVRDAELTLGSVNFEVSESAKKNLRGRKSVYVSKDMKKGERFTNDNIKVVRPGLGLHPKYYFDIIGKISNRDLSFGDRMSLDYVAEE